MVIEFHDDSVFDDGALQVHKFTYDNSDDNSRIYLTMVDHRIFLEPEMEFAGYLFLVMLVDGISLRFAK